MRRFVFGILILLLLAMPVSAAEWTAPTAPDSAEDLMPVETESFGEGLWEILTAAIRKLEPELAEAAGICLSLIAVVMIVSVLQKMTEKGGQITDFAASLAIGGILLYHTNSLIRLGADTVTELSDYGKLLLPVMTGALAAQGGVTSSTALYAGTVLFDTLLSTAISKLLIPMVYMFLALAVANGATGDDALKKLGDFVKWLMTWFLKIVLYVFTGYMGITGVISGTADAASVKATKLTISGMVPVVGGILADASETVIVGAGVMKSAVGVYGLLAVIAVWISPFLQIGVQYLLLKATAAVCGVFGVKRASDLIQSFSVCMGLLLAMTGTVCFFLLISTVCFMKGVS